MHTQLPAAHLCAANDDTVRGALRHRTVPIPATIHAVPGYPQKLSVYKIAASKFWQVRCWIAGQTHRRSTKTSQLRTAQSFARLFYEQLLATHYNAHDSVVTNTPNAFITTKVVKPSKTFGAMAAQMYANEQARQERGEFTYDSLQVLRNRLDAHILTRWAKFAVADVDYNELLTLSQFLSTAHSSITVHQYLSVTRKVLQHAVSIGELNKLPEFPKIKITTNSRGAFTPTEYWKIIRKARALRGATHPQSRTKLRQQYKLRTKEALMPPDLAWAISFMVNCFLRPGDLTKMKHKHIEVMRGQNTYLRLTIPETKKHGKPIVSLQPAVRVYDQICKYQAARNFASEDDYLFLPHLADRRYAQSVLSLHFNWVLEDLGLKLGVNDQPRSLYCLRHSAITFRLLYGQGIDLLTLARNARTSVEIITKHYASTVTGEQNIGMLQSRRNANSRNA